MDLTKRDNKKSKKFVFPKICLCGLPAKEFSKSTKKLDAVRRCDKGYEDVARISAKKN